MFCFAHARTIIKKGYANAESLRSAAGQPGRFGAKGQVHYAPRRAWGYKATSKGRARAKEGDEKGNEVAGWEEEGNEERKS